MRFFLGNLRVCCCGGYKLGAAAGDDDVSLLFYLSCLFLLLGNYRGFIYLSIYLSIHLYIYPSIHPYETSLTTLHFPPNPTLPSPSPSRPPKRKMRSSHLLSLLLLALPAYSTPLPLRTTQHDTTACKAMTVIFARGTTETGTLGTLTGPPFVSALAQAVGGADKMSVQGVPYPADIPGFLAGGDATGSQTMANMISQTLSACPNTKVVMSGYSQGGQLVHNAAKLLPAATMAKVSSVVIFGDPDNGSPVAGASAANTKVICHTGDNICAHGDLILTPHLTYGGDASAAAAFVVAAAGM
ncbi:separase/separin [Clarireedia jacksonii]